MKNFTIKRSGFTLIELLMVIAIIGILAGILIPTVSAVKKQANVAASKAQLSNYVKAITMFKGDYGYYPDFGETVQSSAESFEVKLNTKSEVFIQTLSGRDTDGSTLGSDKLAELGNRRGNAYHSFSETEFYADEAGVVDTTKLADRFNNQNIVFVIDADGDGVVTPNPDDSTLSDALGANDTLRSDVTAYVEPESSTDDYPAYSLWN